MDADAVQARINQAIAPLLKRIEALQTENKDVRQILKKIQTPKTANQCRVNPCKPTTQKPIGKNISKPCIQKKEPETEKPQMAQIKEEEAILIQKVNNPYSNQDSIVNKMEKQKKQNCKTPNMEKKEAPKPKNVPVAKKDLHAQKLKSPQIDKKTPLSGERSHKMENKKQGKTEKKEYMKKVQEIIEETAKNQQKQVYSIEKEQMEKQAVKQNHHKKQMHANKAQGKNCPNLTHVKKEKKISVKNIQNGAETINTENENPNIKKEQIKLNEEKNSGLRTQKSKKQVYKKPEIPNKKVSDKKGIQKQQNLDNKAQ